ncbi:MAG: tetratricopeptide repeat protein [Candidatus Aenigmatarchaeota archaeon]
MPEIDLDRERKLLDREITFFHFKKAKKKVIKCLKIAKKIRSDFFFFYFLAQKYILEEKFYWAIYYLDRAIKLRESDGCSYNDKAICLADLGKYNEALNCFNQGIKRDPNCVSLYHNKGWLLNLLGRHKEAILCFKKALELEDNRAETLYSLADTYLNLNQKERARKYFLKTIKAVYGKSKFVYRETLKRLKEI